MKVKDKPKKRKSKVEALANPAIKKTKKLKKFKKIHSDGPVAAVVKKEFVDCGESSRKRIPLRQQIWNQYLKTFYEVEKLNQKQKQIMQFCTSKSLTPPKRKGRFLNFIRNCFVNQAEVTDEQINELFDLLLKKYDDYKSGTYRIAETDDSVPETKSTLKLSKNKKKKLNRSTSNDDLISSTTVEQSELATNDEKRENNKPKKRKRARVSKRIDIVDLHE